MPDIEDEDYYHGLLPREDIPHLLKYPGDYLIRISQQKITDPRQTIVSVCIRPGEQKHFVLQHREENGKSSYSVDGGSFYSTVQELLEYYKTSKKPFSGEQPNTVPVRFVVRAPWELLHDNITMEKKLGEGAFGEVWQGKLKFPQLLKEVNVAIKVAKMEEMNKEKIKEVMKEARLMRNYDHINVVKLFGVAVEREPLLIVMEFVSGGALDSYLKKNKCEVKEKMEICLGAALGIEYLHKKNCIHRDLAARNCLYAMVGEDKIIKIADFGLSREGKMYQLTSARMVPVKWLAPETISTLTYTPKSDVWSFGVLVWEIFANGEEPYPGMTNGEAKECILKGTRNKFNEECPPKVCEYVTKEVWVNTANGRPDMTQVSRKFEEFTGGKKDNKKTNAMPDAKATVNPSKQSRVKNVKPEPRVKKSAISQKRRPR